MSMQVDDGERWKGHGSAWGWLEVAEIGHGQADRAWGDGRVSAIAEPEKGGRDVGV